ncbi:MAG: hypothetical protein HN509_18470 [Halobacteriovoraceae bacterium]|jgi:hypothetical protein|nr:hypothetical protein [Halobacteriovoraceae bacterium]MBT5094146.1 hypothetical protein [Halobacteriovoraceae bacterium]
MKGNLMFRSNRCGYSLSESFLEGFIRKFNYSMDEVEELRHMTDLDELFANADCLATWGDSLALRTPLGVVFMDEALTAISLVLWDEMDKRKSRYFQGLLPNFVPDIIAA